MKNGAGRGFTLLEMLLAITLLSMIMGVILGGLHLGRRAWETGRVYEAVSEVEEAARAIRAQFSHTLPIQTMKRDNSFGLAFQGGPSGCRFVALSEGGGQWGGLIATQIASDGASEVADIAIWTRVFRAEEWGDEAGRDMRMTSVLRGVAYFKLSYFGEIEKGHPPAWSDQWIDREALPLLVSVRIGANRSGRVVDASFTVALRQR
jgi:general secretion pathway protein J